MNVNAAKKIVEEYVSKSSGVTSHATSAFKVKDGYVFSMRPNKWKKDDILMDPFFKVSANGKITEYSPVMDPREFREGMKNMVEF